MLTVKKICANNLYKSRKYGLKKDGIDMKEVKHLDVKEVKIKPQQWDYVVKECLNGLIDDINFLLGELTYPDLELKDYIEINYGLLTLNRALESYKIDDETIKKIEEIDDFIDNVSTEINKKIKELIR